MSKPVDLRQWQEVQRYCGLMSGVPAGFFQTHQRLRGAGSRKKKGKKKWGPRSPLGGSLSGAGIGPAHETNELGGQKAQHGGTSQEVEASKRPLPAWSCKCARCPALDKSARRSTGSSQGLLDLRISCDFKGARLGLTGTTSNRRRQRLIPSAREWCMARLRPAERAHRVPACPLRGQAGRPSREFVLNGCMQLSWSPDAFVDGVTKLAPWDSRVQARNQHGKDEGIERIVWKVGLLISQSRGHQVSEASMQWNEAKDGVGS